MNDLDPLGTKEVAKTVGKGIDAARELGEFAERRFGDAFRFLGMAAADASFLFFMQNRYRVMQKVAALIDERGYREELVPISERYQVDLIEAISNEPDDALQEVWAAYIANAMDPRVPRFADRQLIGIIRMLEPEDLKLFKRLWPDEFWRGMENYYVDVATLSSDPIALSKSLARLSGLGLFSHKSSHVTGWVDEPVGRMRITIVTPTDHFEATPLLESLLEAVLNEGNQCDDPGAAI